MALRERLIEQGTQGSGTGSFTGTGQNSFQEMKARLHRTLINRMDLTKLQTLTQEQVHAEVSRLAESVLAQEAMPLSPAERERLVNDVQHELFGLGPLEPLLADPTISDILVNSHKTIYVERRGKLEVTNVAFKNAKTLFRGIERVFFSLPGCLGVAGRWGIPPCAVVRVLTPSPRHFQSMDQCFPFAVSEQHR